MNPQPTVRYHILRRGLKWHVVTGTGTRSSGSFWTKTAALRMAGELLTAYLDGKFVGELNARWKQEWPA